MGGSSLWYVITMTILVTIGIAKVDQDHVIKEYLHGWESVKVTHHPARFGSHKHCGNGVLKKFVSLTMVTMKMGNKQTITVIIATVAIRNNTSSKTKIFYIRTTTDKTELTGKEQGNKKCCNLKKIHFQ